MYIAFIRQLLIVSMYVVVGKVYEECSWHSVG